MLHVTPSLKKKKNISKHLLYFQVNIFKYSKLQSGRESAIYRISTIDQLKNLLGMYYAQGTVLSRKDNANYYLQ